MLNATFSVILKQCDGENQVWSLYESQFCALAGFCHSDLPFSLVTNNNELSGHIWGSSILRVAFTSSDMSKISYLNSKKKSNSVFFSIKLQVCVSKWLMIWLGKYMYQFDTSSRVEKNPNRKFPIISSRWASFNISEGKWVFGFRSHTLSNSSVTDSINQQRRHKL